MFQNTKYREVFTIYYSIRKGFPGGSDGKESTCNAGDIRDAGLIPGSGRSLGGGHGNPQQYSCLGNPMDRGGLQSWWATVQRVAKNRTQLKQLSMQPSILYCGPYRKSKLEKDQAKKLKKKK